MIIYINFYFFLKLIEYNLQGIFSLIILQVDTLSLGHSLQIMSVVPSLKMFNKKYQTGLISESSHFVAVYRKV